MNNNEIPERHHLLITNGPEWTAQAFVYLNIECLYTTLAEDKDTTKVITLIL